MACETDGIGASRPRPLYPFITGMKFREETAVVNGMQFPEGETVVVVAVDRSKQAEQAVQYYFKRFHRPDNHVVLLHVPEISNMAVPVHMPGRSSPPYPDAQRWWDEEKAHWDALKEKYSRLLKECEANWTFKVEHGAFPGQIIVQFAEKSKASLIVTGAGSRVTLRKTVMGSVSDYVINHASIPVMVCREPRA